MTPVESEIVMDMLGTCENPPKFEVETLDYLGAVTGEDKPTADPEETVYGSCEEAEDAGEERVQGSQGGGRGVPEGNSPIRPGRGRRRSGVRAIETIPTLISAQETEYHHNTKKPAR